MFKALKSNSREVLGEKNRAAAQGLFSQALPGLGCHVHKSHRVASFSMLSNHLPGTDLRKTETAWQGLGALTASETPVMRSKDGTSQNK